MGKLSKILFHRAAIVAGFLILQIMFYAATILWFSEYMAQIERILRIISALVFFVCFTVYVASGFKAGGILFSSVLGIDPTLAMIVFGLIIILYTFTGGYKAVCWTDFFQALLMLVALLPIMILFPFFQKFLRTGLTVGAVKG